jgi:membrane fusion protein (multidrug efflux system)
VFLVATGQDGKARAQERKVVAGATLGGDVVILEGLQPGEQVAVSGSFKLYEGALVAVTTADAAANGNGRGQ